jgi:sulfofructose kinase
MKPVVGIGIACLDHLIVVPESSKHGGRISDYRMDGGGLTATALVAAARLGAPSQLWTCLGDDEAGHAIIHDLVRQGIDTRGIHFVRGARSPVSVVHVESPSGERVIYHYRGDAFERAGPPPAFEGIEKAGALLVDSCWHEGALAGARRAHDAGVPVIGDFDPRRDLELAASLDCLIVSESVGEDLAPSQGPEAALYRLREFGPKLLALTVGARGCWYLAGDAVRHCPAFPVKVVDTTGAGDAFHGAFAFALAQGWHVDEAIKLACAVGALCCTAVGGRAGLPDFPTALAFMQASSGSVA